jgi:hypothetical protein
MAISAEELEEFTKEVDLEDQDMYFYYHENLEKEIMEHIAEQIREEIDREIMVELIKEIERDKKIVKGILPDKLFEV